MNTRRRIADRSDQRPVCDGGEVVVEDDRADRSGCARVAHFFREGDRHAARHDGDAAARLGREVARRSVRAGDPLAGDVAELAPVIIADGRTVPSATSVDARLIDPVGSVERIETPGATTLSVGPMLEKSALTLSLSTAPTETTPGSAAG